MVRGKYRRYSDEDLNTALRLIAEGKVSQNKASKDFNTSRQTLNRLSNGKNNSKRGGGRPTILTHEQEKLVVSALVNMDSWGFAQSEMQTAKVIKLFMDSTGRKNTFKEGVLGRKFMRLFYARWKNELSRRSPEHLTMSRATACSENVVNSWFRLLGTWLIKLDLKAKPAQIFNCDESGFNTDSSSEKFFTKRGRKNPVKVVGGSGKESYTVLSVQMLWVILFHPMFCLKVSISAQNGAAEVQKILVTMLLIVAGWRNTLSMLGCSILSIIPTTFLVPFC